MSLDEPEYVVAPWGTDGCETKDVTVELSARDLVAQLEVPRHVLERTADLGEKHDISPEQALAERLERNRAQISLMAAQSVNETGRVKEHLINARESLEGVGTFDTTEIESKIERVWNNELTFS